MTEDLYPQSDRAKARLAHKRIVGLSKRIADSRRGGEPLRQADFDYASHVTGSVDLDTQFKMLNAMADEVRKLHLDRLYPLAKDDFAAYCEVMSPDEPPTSPWHVFLTGILQRIDTDPTMNNLVLNCPPGHAKPVWTGTPVQMADGSWKLLDDIRTGDRVITHMGPRTVTAVHNQGIKTCLKITTHLGREIFAAPDHPFLMLKAGNTSRKPFKLAEDLSPGDWLTTARASSFEDTSDHSIEQFRMAASIMNARPMNNGNKLRFTSLRRDVLEAVKADADSLGLKSYLATHCENSHRITLAASSMSVLSTFCDPYTPVTERRVPDWVYRGSWEKRKAYIERIFNLTARPYSGSMNLYINFASHKFAEDFQRLMLGMDVTCAIDSTRGKPGCTVFYLPWSGVFEWLDQGFVYDGQSVDIFKRRLEGKARPSYERHYYTGEDSVDSVEMIEQRPMKCLTVEEAHTFSANGIVVKNSTYASRLFISWRMGRDPDLQVLGASHTQNFVEKQFSKIVREQTQTEAFRKVFPGIGLDPGSKSMDQWNIANHKGLYVARGVGQSIHGFRFNMVVIDDPYPSILKARSPAYREEVKTFVLGDIGTRMLPGGKIFLVMTRFDSEDITQTIIDMNEGFPDEFKFQIIAVPAICYDPEHDVMGREEGELLWDFYDHDHFKVQLQKLKYAQFSLIHQQMTDAVNPESLASKFQFYEQLPHLTKAALKEAPVDPTTGEKTPDRASYFKRVVLSVDTANKDTQRADYSVVQVWGQSMDHKHYLMDQKREKVDFNNLITLIERTARLWNVDAILVEDKGNGLSYIQNRGATKYQGRRAPAPIIPISVAGNQGKGSRLDSASPMIESGEVFLPTHATWLDAFMQEVGQFPDGSHDDQVDAMSQYLNWVRTKRTRYGSKKIGSFG